MSTITAQPNIKLTKGEKTKQHILCSAITILADRGVKGATHRAIAEHANIQLSLTTYYFKDIQDLIQSAFVSNSNNLLTEFEYLFSDVCLLLAPFNNSELKKVATRQKLRLQVNEKLTKLIINLAHTLPKQIIVEQQMYTEAHNCAATYKIMQQHHQRFIQLLTLFTQRFSKTECLIDAELLLFTIQHLCNQCVAQTTDYQNKVATMLQQVSPILCKVKA